MTKGVIRDERHEWVDVPLLYKQYRALMRAYDNCSDPRDYELLEGLINYIEDQIDHLDPERKYK